MSKARHTPAARLYGEAGWVGMIDDYLSLLSFPNGFRDGSNAHVL
jgi:hypothetical protein